MRMSKKESLTKKMYQALNIMICESKIARSYGTGHRLTYSDISLLKCVQHNENAKAGDLSQYLGITNGAVAQLAKKLEGKGYLEPYRITGNKKEVYYRLTAGGEAACQGYDEHYGKMRSSIEDYISTLDDGTIEKIIGLFDLVADSTAVYEHCSIKHAAGKTGRSQETAQKRCKKCQRIY
jgi:DNA-binding MarR family transcriptional regulator